MWVTGVQTCALPISFAVGDKVFLRLQPYIQSSVVRRASHKLAFKFFGPYSVIERVGLVAYKLDLPAGSRVHPVFHVSQLKQCVGDGVQVSPLLPPPDALFQVPERVLQQRLRRRGHRTITQVLVQWSGDVAAHATWEDLERLRHHFPFAPAWGQAGAQEEGIVNDLPLPGVDAASEAGGRDKEEAASRPKRVRRAPAWLSEGNWTT